MCVRHKDDDCVNSISPKFQFNFHSAQQKLFGVVYLDGYWLVSSNSHNYYILVDTI